MLNNCNLDCRVVRNRQGQLYYSSQSLHHRRLIAPQTSYINIAHVKSVMRNKVKLYIIEYVNILRTAKKKHCTSPAE